VGKIAEKAVTTWHCILSAELTKTHSLRQFFWRFCPLGKDFKLLPVWKVRFEFISGGVKHI